MKTTSRCAFVGLTEFSGVVDCFAHAALIPMPLAPEDSLQLALSPRTGTGLRRCEIFVRPASALDCISRHDHSNMFSGLETVSPVLFAISAIRLYCWNTTEHKSNTQSHTNLGDLLMDRPRKLLRTKANSLRYHLSMPSRTVECLFEGLFTEE